VHHRPEQGFIAPAHLARNDRRPQHLLGVVVRGRHLGIVQEYQPLAAMSSNVVVQALSFRTPRSRQRIEPIVEALLDLPGAAAPSGILEGSIVATVPSGG
jgi:hypothetical protein